MPIDQFAGGSMPASSLDPYTRLLASLADAATKARQSMHSATLLTLAAAILCVAVSILAVTSVLWGPALFVFSWMWLVATFWRLASWYGGRACDKTRKWAQMFFNNQRIKLSAMSGDERSRHLRTQAAIGDHSFLRTIFDALPGVDTERVLERVDRLSLFHIAPPRPPSWGTTAGERSPTASDRGDGEGGTGAEGPARSPMQELYLSGLLAPIPTDMENEQQASWQSGRAFESFRAVQSLESLDDAELESLKWGGMASWRAGSSSDLGEEGESMLM